MTTISIGSTLHISAASPAAETVIGYAALTWAEVGGVTSYGTKGATSEDVTVAKLKDGQTEHFNGTFDGGIVPVSLVYEAADAGVVIVEAGINSNTTHSFKITDPAGRITYNFGRIANGQMQERTPSGYEQYSFDMRINSADVVDP